MTRTWLCCSVSSGRTASGASTPTEEQLRALLGSHEVGPLQFVNLFSYHYDARYPEGHELAGAGLSGAEAYGRYGAVALDHVMQRGGTLMLYNDVLQVLIGASGPWDRSRSCSTPGSLRSST